MSNYNVYFSRNPLIEYVMRYIFIHIIYILNINLIFLCQSVWNKILSTTCIIRQPSATYYIYIYMKMYTKCTYQQTNQYIYPVYYVKYISKYMMFIFLILIFSFNTVLPEIWYVAKEKTVLSCKLWNPCADGWINPP